MTPSDRYSVIVIDSDPDSAKTIVKYINDMRDSAFVEETASSFEDGYQITLRKKPKVLIMEIGNDIDVGLQRIRTVVERLPQTMVFATSEDKSADSILKVMRAGADEYLVRPIASEDLVAALQKHGRLWVSKEPAGEKGKVISFFSPKGGVGTTTLAINVAANIFNNSSKPTIVVDMDLDAGDVCTFLNLEPPYTITDVTVNMSRMDVSFLQGVIAKHESGIHVLAEPHKVAEIKSIRGGDVKRIIGLLQSMYSYIIIDLHTIFDDCSLAAFEISDHIFLPFVLSLPGIKNMVKYMRSFKEYGIEREKIELVVNRHLKKGEIKVEDAEQILEHKVFKTIPNEYDTAIDCLNKGEPLIICNPRSRLNSSLKEFASDVINLLAKGA